MAKYRILHEDFEDQLVDRDQAEFFAALFNAGYVELRFCIVFKYSRPHSAGYLTRAEYDYYMRSLGAGVSIQVLGDN